MKVIYKTSMVGKINEEIYKAELSGKEVDKIILTPDEWLSLKKEFKHYLYTVPSSSDDLYNLDGAVAKFKDIRIFVSEE